MRKIRRLLASIMVALMVLTVAPLSDFAGLDFNIWANAAGLGGELGKSLTWTLNLDTHELVISGMGSMPDYDSSGNVVEAIKEYSFEQSYYGINMDTTSDWEEPIIPEEPVTPEEPEIPEEPIDCLPWNNLKPFIKSIRIEDGVTDIGDYAFYNCSKLVSVTLSDSIIDIGQHAFENCAALENIMISYSVRTIGNSAFRYCDSITSITLPDSVTLIGSCAFYGCENLTYILLGSNIETIEPLAFENTMLFHVFYRGSESQFNLININMNYRLLDSTWHYNVSDDLNSLVTVADVLPTCTSSGCMRYRCNIEGCDHELAISYGEATGHTEGEVVKIVKPVCGKEDGYTIYKCSDCNEQFNGSFVSSDYHKKTNVLKVVDPVCGHNEGYTQYRCYCGTIFNDDYISKNHSMGDLVKKTEATCTEDAYEYYVCADCGEEYSVLSENALGHSYEDEMCVRCSDVPEEIQLNEFIDVSFTKGNLTQWFVFKPDVDGTYCFYSDSQADTVGYLYDSEMNVVGSGSYYHYIFDVRYDENFAIKYNFTAGNIYYLKVSLEDESDSYDIKIKVTDNFIGVHAYIFFESVGSTCTGGHDDYVCINCGAFRTDGYYYAGNHSFSDGGCIGCGCRGDFEDHLQEFRPTDGSSVVIDNDRKLISGVPSGLAYYDLTNDYITACVDLDIEVERNDIVGTGSKVKLKEFYDELLAEYTIVVFGDVNGDGFCDGQDAVLVSCIADGMLTRADVSDAVYMAADFNCDGIVNSYDVDALNEAGLTQGHPLMEGKTADFYYKNSSDGVIITGMTSENHKQVIIPEQIAGKDVIGIADGTFEYNETLTEISIPDTVKYIGDKAFYQCLNLTEIVIPSGVTDIGDKAFGGCKNLINLTVDSRNIEYSNDENGVLFNKDKTELVWYPEGSISEYYTIPNSVKTIGDYAFYNCQNLTSVTISDGVINIGNGAFYNCMNLVNVTIPDSVINIGNDTFYNCISFSVVILPDSVMRIGCGAFYNTGYFQDATNWENNSLYIGNHLITVSSEYSGLFLIKDGTKSIADQAFYNCYDITGVTIPDSVSSIGAAAFVSCYGITDIIIPKGVTTIGGYAFYDCWSLESITISDSVTSIGNYAFYYCENIVNVNYKGDKTEWNLIDIGEKNDLLLDSTINFESN